MNTTEWFPSTVKPVHKGVYERFYGWGTSFAYFNGKDWGVAEDTPNTAFAWRNLLSAERMPWRGLTEPSEW